MIKPLGRNALKEYSVNLEDNVEELAWSFYDFTAYAAAGQTSLSFFQNPVGQGGKTQADTNMEAAGQIPRGQNFLVENIAVEFFPTLTVDAAALTSYADDVKAVAESGYLDFVVGSKSYKREGPIGLFPPRYRVAGFASTGLAAGNIEYASVGGMQHSIIPVRLTSNQNFSVTLKWPVAVALPSTVAGRIGVRLGGRLYRNAQ
jgi:hypothetical protein